MKKILFLIFSVLTLTLFTACGESTAENVQSTDEKAKNIVEQKVPEPTKSNGKILVAYFSRAGDNYQVGIIEKGNTHIMADMIAEYTGADEFEIKTVKPYPEEYRACTEVAKEELQQNARPEIVGKVENMAQYDTIFLGYPIWWSDLPMAVYTFLESYDFNGKTIIPFCTSAGNNLTGKESDIPQFAKGATIRNGLGIQGKLCQENPDSVRQSVNSWLNDLGF